MKDQSPAIVVNNLQKSFKKVTVLQDVSFTVEKGSIFALLGPNGSGKTTTINILTTLLSTDGGTAIVDGLNVASHADKVRDRISLTGQFAAVDAILTARENLMLIGELRHIKNPAHTATALLAQFELTDAADRRAATFSGGMRRRLDIAMSLIGNPSIVFLDEPTTGLDPQSRNDMWETIKKLANNGTTVFLTTQYLEEADQLADKIAILNHGRIVAEGTAVDLKRLLPHGQVTFVFLNQKQLSTAATLFQELDPIQDDNTHALTITTDGSMAQMAHIFNQMKAAKIEPSEFSQKVPTLDDVFLKIINDNKEKK